MSDRIQWVNLPSQDTESLKRSKFVGDGVESVDHMGREIYIEADFDSKGAQATLIIVPDSQNAASPVLSAEVLPDDSAGRTGVDRKDDGKVRFKVALSSAGGDKFKFKIKGGEGEEKELPQSIETRRILYYQLIRVEGVAATEAVLTSHLEDEFLNEGNKHYIKLVRIQPGKSMVKGPSVAEDSDIMALAREAYSHERDPFCFAAILVDQIGTKRIDNYNSSAEIDDQAAEFEVYGMGPLWRVGATPKEQARNEWFLEGTFVEDDGDKRAFKIDPSWVKPKDPSSEGKTAVFIADLTQLHLPQGTKGKIKLKFLVFDFSNGVSFRNNNLVCVATRSNWKARPSAELKTTLVHEAGHKVGMVPEGQSTYYFLDGRHCDRDKKKCIMYGEFHPARSDRFCEVCSPSLRGLNLGSENPGFQPF
jgi:type VI secretion system secreted protein VgrG